MPEPLRPEATRGTALETKADRPRADLQDALGWIALGVAIADRLAHDGPAGAQHINPYTVPGLLPGPARHRDDPAGRRAGAAQLAPRRARAAGAGAHRRRARAAHAASGSSWRCAWATAWCWSATACRSGWRRPSSSPAPSWSCSASAATRSSASSTPRPGSRPWSSALALRRHHCRGVPGAVPGAAALTSGSSSASRPMLQGLSDLGPRLPRAS